MKRINIVAWNNGGGLSRDVETLVDALPGERFEVSLNGAPLSASVVQPRRIVHRALNLGVALRLRGRRMAAYYDLNLFLEDISPEFFKLARVNAFLPNPEWFRGYMKKFLRGVDVVFCKTEHAQEIYSRLGAQTRYVGFTSDDRMDPSYSGERSTQFLHVAGRSWQKGTQPLVDVWLRHPEWPKLTVVQNAKTYSQSAVESVEAANVNHVLRRLDDQELIGLQNSHAIHLCPSEVEGFGHCIVEAMSAGALTVTTNAPPMNELINPERGVLVDYNRTAPQRLGTNFYVDPDDLEKKIEVILAMSASEREQLGNNARKWYLENDRLFRSRLLGAVDDCVSP